MGMADNLGQLSEGFLRRRETEQIVHDEDRLVLENRGDYVLFGRDPQRSDEVREKGMGIGKNGKFVKLGLEDPGISRLLFRLGLSEDGKVKMEVFPGKSPVYIEYMDRQNGEWTQRQVTENVKDLYNKGKCNIVLRSEKNFIRLTNSSMGKDDQGIANISWRVEMNPADEDLNLV